MNSSFAVSGQHQPAVSARTMNLQISRTMHYFQVPCSTLFNQMFLCDNADDDSKISDNKPLMVQTVHTMITIETRTPNKNEATAIQSLQCRSTFMITAVYYLPCHQQHNDNLNILCTQGIQNHN